MGKSDLDPEKQKKILSTAFDEISKIAAKAAKELQQNHDKFNSKFEQTQKEIRGQGKKTDGFIV